MRPWVCALALLAAPAWAARCGDELDAKARRVIEADGWSLAWASIPSPIPLDRHFGLDVIVCDAPVQALRVDADMPVHRHGMNYRVEVVPRGAGHFEARGLLFHMPGRWRLIFDVEAGGRTQRLTQEIDVR
jgi:hypothetical protein